MKNRGVKSQAFTPALQKQDGTSATESEDKAELLQVTFFSMPSEADLRDLKNYKYLEPLQMLSIGKQKLSNAIL